MSAYRMRYFRYLGKIEGHVSIVLYHIRINGIDLLTDSNQEIHVHIGLVYAYCVGDLNH